MGGGSSENIPFFESPRTALVITLYHEYVQLVHSRIGMVMTLGLELWPSIIIARRKYTSFKSCCLCCIVDCSSKTALITTVISQCTTYQQYSLCDASHVIFWPGRGVHLNSPPNGPDLRVLVLHSLQAMKVNRINMIETKLPVSQFTTYYNASYTLVG